MRYRNRGAGGGCGPTDLMDTDISFPLHRLFDPFNLDHIPERKRMSEFEHRDLAHVKHYKAAVKIFGGPLSRKRVIVAPPMETPMKHRLGLYVNKRETPPPPVLNTKLDPQIPPEKPPPEELVLARQAQEREDKYKAWFKERQTFRNDLENMGLNIEYMTRKPNKTILEKRVLRQLEVERNKELANQEVVIEETPEPSQKDFTSDTDSVASGLPSLQTPAPLGLLILDKHMKEQKLRLIDLFTEADKNKDWKISREEFIQNCEQREIPLSRGLLEDMLITLDMNMDDELDYKEMARGMEMTRRQIRDDKRKELSRENTNASIKSHKSSVSDTPPTNGVNQGQPTIKLIPASASQRTYTVKTASTGKQTERSGTASTKSKHSSDQMAKSESSKKSEMSSKKSASSKMSRTSSAGKGTVKSDTTVGLPTGSKSDRSNSPSHLEPPDYDTRQEQLILKSEEAMVDLRKRDREGLKGYNSKLTTAPGTIKTGNKAIDDHCRRSTLVGDIGEMVDKFRQKRLQEYHAVLQLCERNGVILSKHLLEKVLLYPPDLPPTELKKLRHPDSAPLVSSHFADPPKRPRTPIEVKHKDKVRRSKSGKLLIDSRHRYPMNKLVSADGYKQNLSTGRAVIRRKVDCWMTFEEYEKLTRHFAIRYQHLHGSTNDNAFWPGHLLDKVRFCMPPYNKAAVRDKEQAIYHRVDRTPAVNYGYEPADAWQTNDKMYTQIGIHDHFKNKTII